MKEKRYTVAGTATHGGMTKVRFANDMVSRVKILAKAGCTDIDLIELPEPMTKLQALEFLKQRTVSGDASYVISSKYSEKLRDFKRRQQEQALKSGSVKV